MEVSFEDFDDFVTAWNIVIEVVGLVDFLVDNFLEHE